MDSWSGRIAVVTGAASGIGAATAIALAKHGITVVGLDLNKAGIEELAANYGDLKGKIHAVECNLMDAVSISKAFDYIEEEFNGVDILVNNAGTRRKGQIFDLSMPDESFTLTIDTIFKGSLVCTRRAFKTMKTKDMGYIININSLLGHVSADARQVRNGSNVYGPTKHAISTFSDYVRLELSLGGNSHIRVTSLSPGCTETGFAKASGADPSIYQKQPALQASDIADAIVYLLGTKPSVNISELTIRPTGETI